MIQTHPPALIERLSVVSAAINTLVTEDPEMSGSQRASLMLAAGLVDQVRQQQAEVPARI
jgi:hypothetical protein